MPSSRAKAPKSPEASRPAVVKQPQIVRQNGSLAAPATIPENKHFARTAVLCLLLAAVILGVYSRALKNPFVNYDDQGYIVENRHVQQGMTLATLRWALTSTYADNWHPLTWMSHALDCQWFGLNATGHHFTSILLHTLNSLLVFLLLYCVTKAPWRSFLVAALFAVHPINVESVAWVAERKNVLSMFFFLLSVGAYGWYSRRPGVLRYLTVAVLFAFGLAAKPMIVTLPFVLLLLDFWPFRRVQGLSASQDFPVKQAPLGRLAIEKVPLLALAAASCAITIVAQRGAITPNQGLPLAARLLNAVYAYSAYIWKTFYPAHLASFYPYEGIRLTEWQFLLSMTFLVAVTFWAWRKRSSHLYLSIGWFWFLGTLVPVIGLIQVGEQAMADRYAYLPLIGIFFMSVWGAADLMQRSKIKARSQAVAAASILAVLCLLAWHQTRFWRSSDDLWAHASRVTEDNSVAEDYLGSALLLQAYEASGARSSPEALAHFQDAVRINPLDPIAHLNIGADFHERGRLREAAEQYGAVLQLTPDPHLVAKALIGLGAVSGQLGDFSAAKAYYLKALKLEPLNQAIFMGLGKLGMQERIQELSTELSRSPSRDGYFQLGQLQQAAGLPADAKASFRAALKLDPSFSSALNALNAVSK